MAEPERFDGPILVTGATGKQGGSLIRSLLEYPEPPVILAVTRSIKSLNSLTLAWKAPRIKLIEGNLNDVPDIFSKALKLVDRISGVYSVQLPAGLGSTGEQETKQGKNLIVESIKHDVRHFVYSSVDRGGEPGSWDNPTKLPHWQTKYEIERFLRESAATSSMTWTILRPTIFMDNFTSPWQLRFFLSLLGEISTDTKTIQFIAVRDIGIIAARALAQPAVFAGKAIGLAGDDLTIQETCQVSEQATGGPMKLYPGLVSSFLRLTVPKIGATIHFYRTEGNKVDVKEFRSLHPDAMNLATWLKTESTFAM